MRDGQDSQATPPVDRAARHWPSLTEWAVLLGGAFLCVHYAWLLDDAFIYFRYVDNFVLAGHGLVYNRGEYVEGFTSPLWTFLLSGLRALSADYWLSLRIVGLLCWAGFWWIAVGVNRRLSPTGSAPFNLPLLYLGFLYGVLCYFTSGVEAPLTLVLAAVFARFALDPEGRGAWLGVALAPLVRPELLLATGVAAAWQTLRTGRAPVRLLLTTLGTSGAWLAFRIVYYADVVPNTFHLKNESHWARGLAYLWDSLGPYGVWLLAPLALVTALALKRRGRLPEPSARLAMLAIALPVLIYVIKVGGDARHFRYLAFPFTLAILSAGGLVEACLATQTPRVKRLIGGLLPVPIAIGVACLHPAQTDGPGFLMRESLGVIDGIDDAMVYRQHWGMPAMDPWSLQDPIDAREQYVATRGKAYSRVRPEYVCYRHYRNPARRAVHSLGLTDSILAHVDMPSERSGHKWPLIDLARDLVALQKWWDQEPRPGMHRAAVEAGVAAPWVGENLVAIEQLEARIYNAHRPLENLALALSLPPVISPPPPRVPKVWPPRP